MHACQLVHSLAFFVALQLITHVNGIDQNLVREAINRLQFLQSLQRFNQRNVDPVPDYKEHDTDDSKDQNIAATLLNNRNQWTGLSGAFGKQASGIQPNQNANEFSKRQQKWTTMSRAWGKRQVNWQGGQQLAPRRSANVPELVELAHQIFKILDTDQDGLIEEDEVRALKDVISAHQQRQTQRYAYGSVDGDLDN